MDLSHSPTPRRHRRSLGWWLTPRRRGCRARLARIIGLPLAVALCIAAVALVVVPLLAR